MKLAISLTTFQREDGKTPFYLRRSIESVLAQSYSDFHIFLVGDKYEKESEFLSIVNEYPQDQMTCYNLGQSYERSKYKNDPMIYWNCAGVSAMNFASGKALEAGFDYVCHLDHDDYWSENHLSVINMAIESFGADWVCTQSKWENGVVIPIIEGIVPNQVVPCLPIPCGVINSSTCYNYRSIPLKYRNVYEEENKIEPADADLWSRLVKYIPKHNLKSYFVNTLTCYHEEEGYLWKH
jgi:glycosyltransferase involved in cell wall biosynthesis